MLLLPGLTQNRSEDGKPDSNDNNRPSSGRSRDHGDHVRRDLADRDSGSTQPPAKRPRPARQPSPAATGGGGGNFHSGKSFGLKNQRPDEDDDIQEVVPVVKSEPRDVTVGSAGATASQSLSVASLDSSYIENSGGESAGGGGSGTIALEESYQDDGYEYEGYDEGAYDDGNGYDPATGLPVASGDGNKGRNITV